jgi:hypothetical protein
MCFISHFIYYFVGKTISPDNGEPLLFFIHDILHQISILIKKAKITKQYFIVSSSHYSTIFGEMEILMSRGSTSSWISSIAIPLSSKTNAVSFPP